MKVLYIVTAYDRHPGDGITPWLVETLHRLRDEGVETEVLAPSYRGSGSGMIDGVMVHRFRYAPGAVEDLTHDQTAPDRVRERPAYLALVPSYVAAASLAARRLARSGDFDVVHVHWPLPHAVPGWAARSAGDIPLVITFHGVEVTFARNSPIPFLTTFLRRAIRTADAVTANSSYTAGLIRSLHDRDVEIVPFGSTIPVPADPPARESPADAGPAELLFVGRLVERKGVDTLLQAMARLPAEPGATLTVVGQGPEREGLERLARSLNVDSRVRFAGFVSSDELAELYRSADAFVLPAVYDAKGDVEGLGVVLIEAAAHGVPLVASAAGGITDIVRDEDTGLLVPPGDADALAAAVQRVLTDDALSRRLSARARDHVDRNYSWPAVTARLRSLYDRVTSHAR